MVLDFGCLVADAVGLAAALPPAAPHALLAPPLLRPPQHVAVQSKRLLSQTAQQSPSQKLGSSSQTRDKGIALLAANGLDAAKVHSALASIDSLAAHPLPTPDSDVDNIPSTSVRAFLNANRDRMIEAAIVNERNHTLADYEAAHEKAISLEWDRAKRRIFDHLAHSHSSVFAPTRPHSQSQSQTLPQSHGGLVPNVSPAPHSSPASAATPGLAAWRVGDSSTKRMETYATVIRDLNNARLLTQEFPLIQAFKTATSSLVTHLPSLSPLLGSWALLSRVLASPKKQHQHRHEYSLLEKSPDTDDAMNFRRMVIQGAREHFQDEFLKAIQDAVASRPQKMGPKPNIHDKIRAYIQIQIQHFGHVFLDGLELVQAYPGENYPFWAHVFFLFRAGKYYEAIDWIQGRLEVCFANEEAKDIMTALKLFKDSESKRVPDGVVKNKLISYWTSIYSKFADGKSHVPATQCPDIFKSYLIKILARADVIQKRITRVGEHYDPLLTTEDHLWLQSLLVLETRDTYIQERYSLNDLALHAIKPGPAHYNHPLSYFNVCIAVGEFERAVNYLKSMPDYAHEALCFAVAMAYFGVLRVTTSPTSMDALTPFEVKRINSNEPTYTLSRFNFAGLIQSYIKHYFKSHTGDVAHTIILVALFGSKLIFARPDAMDFSRDYTTYTHNLLIDLVLETKSFDALLGVVKQDSADSRGGLLFTLRSLVFLDDYEEYRARIVKPAAERAGRIYEDVGDVVQLYHLAGEFNSVLGYMNSRLVAILEGRGAGSATASASTSALASTEDMVEHVVVQAQEVIKYYKSLTPAWKLISESNKEAASLLINLVAFMKEFNAGRFDRALTLMESYDLFPLSADSYSLNEKVERLRHMDESIVKTIPNILIWTMTCIHNLYTTLSNPSSHSSSLNRNDALRQSKLELWREMALRIMSFAGCIHFRMPAQAYADLNKMFVFMS